MSYMLAIEPHRGQADILREDVGKKTRTKLTVVNSMFDALTAIDDQMPELVLLSALTPPHEESQLIARLRSVPHATAPEILMIPALDGPGAGAAPKHTLFDRFCHRKQLSGCDPSAFAVQLSTYFVINGRSAHSPVLRCRQTRRMPIGVPLRDSNASTGRR